MSSSEVFDKGELLIEAINNGLAGQIEFDPQDDESNRKGWMKDFVDELDSIQDSLNSPESRLECFLDPDSSLRWTIATNAGLRGKDLGELLSDIRSGKEGRSILLALHTPAARDKFACFTSGVEAICEWANSSEKTTEEKLQGIAEAYEALIIWTHIFNDGNGRTSRFIRRIIKSGFNDIGELEREVVSNETPRPDHNPHFITKQAAIEYLNNSELCVPNEDELRANLDSFPDDIEGMKLNIAYLLDNLGHEEL